MAIEQAPGGGTIITGDRDTRLFQLLQWKYAIKLEIKGINVAKRSVTAHVKRELGFKGSKEKVLAQLEAYIDQKAKEREADPNG